MASLDLKGLGCTSNPTVLHGYSLSQYPICDNIPSNVMHKIAPGFFTVVAVFLLVLVSAAVIRGLLIARVHVAHDRGLELLQAWEGPYGLVFRSCGSCASQRLRRRTMKSNADFDLDCEEVDLGVVVIEKELDRLSGTYIR